MIHTQSRVFVRLRAEIVSSGSGYRGIGRSGFADILFRDCVLMYEAQRVVGETLTYESLHVGGRTLIHVAVYI